MAILTQRGARQGWWTILTNFWGELDRDHVSIMAAGVAFYALLSIFPGMSALISVYGLVSDPATIENQLNSLAGVLPQEALKLLSDQLHALVAAPRGKLGFGLLVSLLIALWSATSGTGALMQALGVAYEERENRGVLTFYGLAIALTVGIGLFALLSLFLIAVVPAIIDLLPFSEVWRDRISMIRWPLLAVLALVALGFLYRYAPARERPCWHCFSAGTIAAAVLWLVGSAGFSFYVARFSSYDKTYGSLGAVVILLMWFYVTAYIILAGAELNSEIEKARARH
ncbi:MAG: YihY/virulence factor BrkB family protein [Alphaproteobacteria bacterium]|nr:YihY/virulence factor BrkB family protein [Alphaproteobacteria bacterium]